MNNNSNPLVVLGGLWLAVTVPVVACAFWVSNSIQHVQPAVVTKTVVVTPTASPSATTVPSVTPTKAVKVVNPTVKGGVK